MFEDDVGPFTKVMLIVAMAVYFIVIVMVLVVGMMWVMGLL